jgi:hypothetical protein
MLYKNLIIGFLLFFLGAGCSNGKKDSNASEESGKGVPRIEFERHYYDFGTIKQGEKVSYTFEFKNTGNGKLIIKDAYAACGCTVPEYEKEPIEPGEEGYVEVIFDSSGRRGNQYKSVKIKANTPIKEKTLTIKAKVIIN